MSAAVRRAVLFDLDGTLVDTALDMHAAANLICEQRGVSPVAFAAFRPLVSKGGRAMLRGALPDADDAIVEAVLPQFLELYGQQIAVHSRLFDGMDAVLAAIEARALHWGVVTNKPEWLARGVLDGLGLAQRCAVLIGGDTLNARKPDPLPLREACRLIGVAVGQAIYVGDDRRDVEAARAAPMPVLAASWGYIDATDDVHDWGADAVVARPLDLLDGWID